METIDTTCTTQSSSLGVAPLLLTQLITTLIQSYCELNVVYPQDQSATLKDNDEFDFIVVGAGSAGSAIANRLTEIPSWRVLLIEAGSDPPIESEIPVFYPIMLQTKYDWFYKTEKSETACKGMINQECFWPKGKMLGGSSAMNAMYYVRGNEKDYDDWQKLGNPGWAYKDVLKYFKKLEIVNGERITPDIHGQEGYVNAEYVPNATFYHTQTIEKMIRGAAVEQGFPFVDDCSSNVKPCITETLFTIKSGVRMSSGKAYLAPIKERKNLVVMKESSVTKLLINDKNHVYGVQVYTNGNFVNMLSKKEVIVSAGSIASPQLLMLSGIGPREDLENLGIRVVKDLKVGYNLQDHIFLTNYYAKLNLPDLPLPETDPLYFYLTQRNEVFAAPISSSLLFMKSNETIERPNIQFHFWNAPPKNPFIASFFSSMNLKPEITQSMLEMNKKWYLLSFLVKLIRPKSRGRVKISSVNPFVAPKIINGYLTDEEDVKAVIEGAKLAARMIKSTFFEGSSLYTIPTAECDRFDKETDQFYECYIRHFMNTVYHAAGTCKMGPQSDPDAVVDSRLKVYGVSGLRVADTSIMPVIVGGNTNIATIMIGEKVSDMIKKDWVEKVHSEL